MPNQHVRVACTAFTRDDRGAVAVVAGLVVALIVGLVAVAIDYSRGSSTRTFLQKTADSAVLAAAVPSERSVDERKAAGLRVFDQLIAEMGDLRVLARDLVYDGQVFRMSADTRLLRRIVGGSEMPISVVAEATTGTTTGKGQEFVFAFDSTRSVNMASEAVSALRDGLDALKRNTGSRDFFVTHMPFSDRVNLGLGRTSWIDVSPVPEDWRGCFEPREERIGQNPHGLTDAAPTPRKDKFLPTAKGYSISDAGQQMYGTDTAVCPSEPITGPTNDVSLAIQAVGRPLADGTGRFDEAMAWAWRLLSPEWRGQWNAPDYPAKYGDRDKTVVFLTDGLTEINRYEVKNPDGTVFGYNAGSAAGMANFEAVCASAKAKGIVIHIIFMDGGNEHFEPYGRRCATSGNHFHKASSTASLRAAFEKIVPKPAQTAVRLIR